MQTAQVGSQTVTFPDEMTPEAMAMAVRNSPELLSAAGIEVKKPNPIESFGNAFVNMPGEALSDVKSLFGGSEEAEQEIDRREYTNPVEGVGGFAGRAGAGIAPYAVAAATSAFIPPAAPLAWAGAFAYTALTSMGQARRGVHQYEERTGEDVGGVEEAAIVAGIGVVNTALEAVWPAKFIPEVGNSITKATLAQIGKIAIAGGRMEAKQAAKIAAKEVSNDIFPMLVKTAGFEGTQEGIQQTLTNAFEAIYDPEKRNVEGLFEGTPEAFALGAIGGPIMAPLVRAGALNEAARQGEAYQKFLDQTKGEVGKTLELPPAKVGPAWGMSARRAKATEKVKYSDDIQFQTIKGQQENISANSEVVNKQIEYFKSLGFPLDDIVYSEEQLFKPDGTPVNAFINVMDGRMNLSPFVDPSTVPHEMLEYMKVHVPEIDPMIERGKEIVGGTKEDLFDKLGLLLDERIQDKGMVDKLKMWLGDFISYAKDKLGLELNLRDIAARIDARMREGVEPIWSRPYAEQLEYQEKQPDDTYASSTNIPKLNIDKVTEDVFRSALSDMHYRTTSWTEIEKQANTILSDHQRMARLIASVERGRNMNAPETYAIRQVARAAGKKITEALITTDELGKSEVFKTAMRIIYANDKLSNIQGKTFNSRKMLGKDLESLLEQAVAKRVEVSELNEDQLARYKKLDKTDPFAVNKFINDLKIPNAMDFLKDIYYNSLLSGPKLLFVANPGINSIWLTSLFGHRAVTSVVSSALGNKSSYVGELGKMVKSIEGSYSSAVARAKEAFLTGETPSLDTRWEYDITDGMRSSFARASFKNKTLTRLFHQVAPVIEGPVRILKAADLFNKTIAFDMQINALAFRGAMKKGFKEGTPEYDEYVQNFLENPPESALKNASEFAKTATFMNDPGKITKQLLNIRNKVPGGFLAMPFVVTLSNIMNRGMELTPGIGVGVGKWNKLSGAAIIAKQLEGTVLTYLLFELFKDNITAELPANPAERDAFIRQGKIPWAVKINNKGVPYKGLEPLSSPFALLASGLSALEKAKTTQDGSEIFSNVVNSMVQYTIDSQYFSNLTKLFDKEQRPTVLRRIPVGFVPYGSFMRTISNWYHLAKGETIYSKETQTVMDELGNVIPGLRDAPSRINAFGENMTSPKAGWHLWYPFVYSEETVDPVEVELERLNKETDGLMGYPAKPDKYIDIRGRTFEIPDDTYREYCYAYGKASKEALGKVIESPSYSKMKPEQKVMALHRMMSAYRARENVKFQKKLKEVGREVRPIF